MKMKLQNIGSSISSVQETMHIANVIIVFAFIVKAHAKELSVKHVTDAQESMDTLVDKLVDKVYHAHTAWFLQCTGLDETMLEKGPCRLPPTSSTAAFQFPMARRLTQAAPSGRTTSMSSGCGMVGARQTARRQPERGPRITGMRSGPSPAELTQRVKKAESIESLIDTHREHGSQFNHIHLSACWISVARQRPAERRWLQRNVKALWPLVQHTV